MYKRLNISMDCVADPNFGVYVKIGQELYNTTKVKVKTNLDDFALSDRSIDGTKMQNDWFPQIQADVFISHSHADKDYAFFLAGYLSNQFGITCFIDSCIWGYCKELQQIIDKKYSDPLIHNKTAYDASLRYTASHVHMMLINAITYMIDKSECFAFLNTPTALKHFDKADRTESPWIYNEISLSKILRINKPARPIKEEVYLNATGSYSETQALKIKYNLDLSHLKKINVRQIFAYRNNVKPANKFIALDAIYNLV